MARLLPLIFFTTTSNKILFDDKIRLIAMPGDIEEAEFVADEIFEIAAVQKRPMKILPYCFAPTPNRVPSSNPCANGKSRIV